MKAPSLRQQYFGDFNRKLSDIRRKINSDIREEILERINKDKHAQDEVLAEEPNLSN